MINFKNAIFPKFDYYSAIWKNFTLEQILEFLHLSDQIETLENHKSLWLIAEAGCNWSTIALCDKMVRIMIPTDDIIRVINPDDPVFDSDFTKLHWSKVKTDISGKGLDALRAKNIPIDNIMRTYPDYDDDLYNNLTMQYYPTRIDIAYDFVNYKPEFMQNLIEFCKNHLTDRIPICHKAGGTDCHLSCGNNETTVYLGSSRSAKRLRIYDKLQEQKYKECPYTDNIEDIKSWFRIELQLRRELSQEMISKPYYNEEFFLNVLKYIYNEYSFRDVTQKQCVPYQWWVDLWDWDEIPNIILNLHYAHYKTSEKSIIDSFDTNIQRILLLISIYGKKGLWHKICEYIDYLNLPYIDNNVESLIRRNKRRKLITALSDLGISNRYFDISSTNIKIKEE